MAADGGALLHSCAVYLYAYDTEQGAYAQQTDAAVGCALLAGERAAASGSDAFSLLLYDAHKAPLLQVPVTPSARFTPQKDHYVNFYDRAQQRNFAMRFKDAASSEAFLSAVALAKAQVLLHASKSFDHAARGNKPAVLVDQLAVGKEDAAPLAFGDVAGVALTKWQGSVASRDEFFSANPLEITRQPPTEATDGGEVRRIRLVEGGGDDDDPFVRLLAGEALLGMQKAAKRLVTAALPHSQEWMIAQVELLKVKKARPSATAAATSATPAPVTQETAAAALAAVKEDDARAQGDHDELVKRMASLSRMGSQSSGLIASFKSRMSSSVSMDSNGGGLEDAAARRASSTEQQALDTAAGRVPVLLAGLQLPGQRNGSFSRSSTAEGAVETHAPSHEGSGASSLAAKVIEPLQQTSTAYSPVSDVASSSSQMGTPSSDMARLMKEQSELARLREQLEESKRQLQSDDVTASAAPTASSPPSAMNGGSSAGGNSPVSRTHRPSASASYTPSSFALLSSTAASVPTSTFSTTPGRWSPSSLELVPSFTSPAVPPSLPAPSFSSSLTPYSTSSFSGPTGFSSGATATTGSGTSRDVENGIVRLQRSSTTIESTLQDLQAKMDRLLNSQHSMKASKFASSTGKFGSSATFSSSTSSSSSSSSTLLKNLEKALSQRDRVQETNARLQEANEELEANVEELQTQHESLQMENRTLLDKLQNGNHLQQEKFRLELRSVQQQLSQTQEQMLVYQEENFQLRSELAAKDEQLAKEKAHLQEDARKQLEQLQRQLQEQVRQDSKSSMDKLASEKDGLEAQVADLMAQKKQWEAEREDMAKELRQAQGQQTQLQDEAAKAQSAQDARMQELLARVGELEAESGTLKQQAEGYRSETQRVEELLLAKEHEMTQLLASKNDQEYAALSELFKEFMNDIYFHFQDAFDEETEFTGKEIVMAIRKILKQNTMDILAKLEEFYQLQAQSRQH